MNSSPARLAIRNYIVLHPDTHVLKNICIRTFSESNRVHLKLAELSEAAHRAITAGDAALVNRIEKDVDRCAAKLWGLTDEELEEIGSSLKELD